MKTETPLISPTLQTLNEELKTGNAAVIDAFWQKIGQESTPLIEPIAGDDQYSLVTFLWRSTEENQDIGVVNNLPDDDADKAMIQLQESDLWYKTYKVHNQTYESYQFSVDGNNVTDPLNPRQHVFPDDNEIEFIGWKSSVLEMPDAPPQPWSAARLNVPAGQVNPHRIHSKILDNEYRVWVYTPPGYSVDDEPYGFLLFLDGWFYIQLTPTPTILDNLLAEGHLPPLAAIMVGDLFGKTRNRDLLCYPPFAEFLTEELLPWARDHYHLSNDLEQTGVVGVSNGGLMAVYMGLHHSDIFGSVISQSGAFRYMPEGEHKEEWLARQYVVTPKLPLKFHLDVGIYETKMNPGHLTCMLSRNRHMRNVLEAKGYPVHYIEYYGGHNPMNWPGTLADGLLALFGKDKRDKDE